MDLRIKSATGTAKLIAFHLNSDHLKWNTHKFKYVATHCFCEWHFENASDVYIHLVCRGIHFWIFGENIIKSRKQLSCGIGIACTAGTSLFNEWSVCFCCVKWWHRAKFKWRVHFKRANDDKSIPKIIEFRPLCTFHSRLRSFFFSHWGIHSAKSILSCRQRPDVLNVSKRWNHLKCTECENMWRQTMKLWRNGGTYQT